MKHWHTTEMYGETWSGAQTSSDPKTTPGQGTDNDVIWFDPGNMTDHRIGIVCIWVCAPCYTLA